MSKQLNLFFRVNWVAVATVVATISLLTAPAAYATTRSEMFNAAAAAMRKADEQRAINYTRQQQFEAAQTQARINRDNAIAQAERQADLRRQADRAAQQAELQRVQRQREQMFQERQAREAERLAEVRRAEDARRLEQKQIQDQQAAVLRAQEKQRIEQAQIQKQQADKLRAEESRKNSERLLQERREQLRAQQRQRTEQRQRELQQQLDQSSSRGLSNPFVDKSPTQIDQMFRAKGFESRGPDPVNGLGGYVNPATGRSYHLDPNNRFGEPPHVDVNRLRTYKGDLGKKKLPMGTD